MLVHIVPACNAHFDGNLVTTILANCQADETYLHLSAFSFFFFATTSVSCFLLQQLPVRSRHSRRVMFSSPATPSKVTPLPTCHVSSPATSDKITPLLACHVSSAATSVKIKPLPTCHVSSPETLGKITPLQACHVSFPETPGKITPVPACHVSSPAMLLLRQCYSPPT
ncbi:hypothetical protein L1987_37812 [Smallanthus sonchifolius]|uniref:Uncharacterized protein n=1 Tax=Smallanthus sonchifolius TaxID=185202 RepID=A0ACB9HIA0_9ASTR|nr:hypothetical protein L1987_37812 [Smallanthus sonchifolius]